MASADYDELAILGVNVDVIDAAGAIRLIIDRSAPNQPSSTVVKPYVEFMVRAAHDAEVHELLNAADLSVADSTAIVWAAHYLYAGRHGLGRFWLTLAQIMLSPASLAWPLVERAGGITFTEPLLVAAAAAKRRVYLVGSPAGGDIETTAVTLARLVPGLQIAGVHTGRDTTTPPGEVTAAWLAGLTADVEATHADIVLVGMGFPLQERVCRYLADHLAHGVAIGEGGSFDYERFGGHHARAPQWIQRLGLEWLWRLGLEPRRWRRQLAIPRFIYLVWRSR